MIDPEDDGRSDADSGHKSMRAAVVACVDTSPVFEFSEHIVLQIDFCVLFIEVMNMVVRSQVKNLATIDVFQKLFVQNLNFVINLFIGLLHQSFNAITKLTCDVDEAIRVLADVLDGH